MSRPTEQEWPAILEVVRQQNVVTKALLDLADQFSDVTGFIYLIGDGENIKIGYSGSHPSNRLRTLQTGHARKLALLGFFGGTQKLERALHRFFSADHVHGEWFQRSNGMSVLIYLCGRQLSDRLERPVA